MIIKKYEYVDENGKCIDNIDKYLENIYFSDIGNGNVDQLDSSQKELEQNNIIKEENH